MKTNSIRRINPTQENPIHQTKVVDMIAARGLLKALYLNLKSAIDQETLVDLHYDGTTTNVAFVMGTTEIKFNLVEGGQL